MNPRRRTVVLAVAALGLALLAAPAAQAGAGGGSAGFSGGGGSGGGGHGSGFALYIVINLLIHIALLGHGLGALLLIALAVLYLLVTRGVPFGQAWWAHRAGTRGGRARRTSARERRVELAAAQAAEEDPAFAPDTVRASAQQLFLEIQSAWDTNNRTQLRGLVAGDLLAEWERRLEDLQRRGWTNHVQPIGEPRVEFVGLTRRGDHDGDRVVVRIEARLKDYVVDRYGRHLKRAGHLGETVHIREFWTLGRQGGHWVLVSIEQGAEGKHALDEQIVATPWSDDRALRDQALVEGAVTDAVPEGTKISEIADLRFQGDARSAVNDLSVADGRFSPDVLEVAARRAVQAWAGAVDGSDRGLAGLATPSATRELLYPGDPSRRTRLVVRGTSVKQIRIVGLDAAAEPPTMSIEVDIRGRRYIEDRQTTAVLSGSRSRETGFTEHWTLALDDDPTQPWRIASVSAAPARA